MLSRLKTITLIINAKAIVIASMAVLSTYFCLYFEITANFLLTLLATAIVFPSMFSINSAYKRRESALDDYGSLKAHGRAIYFATRDWLDDAEPQKLDRCRNLLGTLVLLSLDNIQEHLENPFDQVGQDDVMINAEKFMDRLNAGATDQATRVPGTVHLTIPAELDLRDS